MCGRRDDSIMKKSWSDCRLAMDSKGVHGVGCAVKTERVCWSLDWSVAEGKSGGIWLSDDGNVAFKVRAMEGLKWRREESRVYICCWYFVCMWRKGRSVGVSTRGNKGYS